MLDQTVMDNPHVKVGELSDKDRKEFYSSLQSAYYPSTHKFVLSDDQEVIKCALSQGVNERSVYLNIDDALIHWDPYSEGYDNGPGDDVLDSWRKENHVMSGAFRGYVAEYASNRFTAQLLESGYDDGTYSPESFVDEMKEWEPPRSDDERHEATMATIKKEFNCLPEDEQHLILNWVVEQLAPK